MPDQLIQECVSKSEDVDAIDHLKNKFLDQGVSTDAIVIQPKLMENGVISEVNPNPEELLQDKKRRLQAQVSRLSENTNQPQNGGGTDALDCICEALDSLCDLCMVIFCCCDEGVCEGCGACMEGCGSCCEDCANCCAD